MEICINHRVRLPSNWARNVSEGDGVAVVYARDEKHLEELAEKFKGRRKVKIILAPEKFNCPLTQPEKPKFPLAWQ